MKGKVICFFGITFKPNTDDIREAPSLTIIPSLQNRGATIRVVDPSSMKNGKKPFPMQNFLMIHIKRLPVLT